MMLKQVKRKLTAEELTAEIDEAMKDPEFKAIVKDFVKRTTS